MDYSNSSLAIISSKLSSVEYSFFQLVDIVNVVGHGIDVVDIDRIGKWIDDPRNPLIPRCFLQEEIDEIGDDVNRLKRLAGVFAAKEAVLKTIGTGFGAGIAFTDVIIYRSTRGAPDIRLRGGAAKAAEVLKINKWLLSISHTGTIAVASALALTDDS